VKTNDFPWITLTLTLWMGAVYLVSPSITPLSYTVLAPWLHSGFDHLWQNLFVFVLIGSWCEMRLGRATFFSFVVVSAYLALYLPIAFEYGQPSRGASGLTKALVGYTIPVLFVVLSRQIESFDFDTRDIAIGIGVLLGLVYLIADSWMTVQRVVGLGPRPAGVAVSAHATGLGLGLFWFGWRLWRHGLADV
jgi:membrane associated rhomboid family serine protease